MINLLFINFLCIFFVHHLLTETFLCIQHFRTNASQKINNQLRIKGMKLNWSTSCPTNMPKYIWILLLITFEHFMHFGVGHVWKMCPIYHKLSKITFFLMSTLYWSKEGCKQVYGIFNKNSSFSHYSWPQLHVCSPFKPQELLRSNISNNSSITFFIANTIRSANVHSN